MGHSGQAERPIADPSRYQDAIAGLKLNYSFSCHARRNISIGRFDVSSRVPLCIQERC